MGMEIAKVLALSVSLGGPAPEADYWAMEAHFQRQHTEAACSAASIATALGALLEKDVAPRDLLTRVGDSQWKAQTARDGDGVSFTELERYLRASLRAMGLARARVEVFRPRRNDPESLALLRALLTENVRRRDGDVVLATFDQGWLLGEHAVGHVSPIGDYDPATGRVLIMDVDPALPEPYWVKDEDLLAAMNRPDSDDPSGDGLLVVKAD